MADEKVSPELVNITIDGKKLRVPKGMNMIEAAKTIGVEIPHYCYHPHLSVVGNCRMCKVEVVGAPKMEIGCNLAAREGLEIRTQESSQAVKDTQAATLEFLLINHPLDCTVCDQAGHCKLQDYHYEYNARPSRFLEQKEHKVKAVPLGPTVMLDGERCIECTRCIRFCDEITETSELGMLNRGDRSVIAVHPGRELNNPLSGTVVDLCPVGALTHRAWRFNTRIWFTKQTDSICPGCSTGCNVRVAERDGQIVQVKARMNDAVNKEWLCDEGRYGFHRFLPERRVTAPQVASQTASWDDALRACEGIGERDTLIFLSPDLLLEEYLTVKAFIDKTMKRARTVVAYRERGLSEVERKLVSPDYACNFRGAQFAGLVGKEPEKEYAAALDALKKGGLPQVLLIGERAILSSDASAEVLRGLSTAEHSFAISTDADSGVAASVKVLLPGRSILEKSGMLINRAGRLQYTDRVIPFPEGTEPEWRVLSRIAAKNKVALSQAVHDRDLTLEVLRGEAALAGLKIQTIKAGGIDLNSYRPGAAASGGTASSGDSRVGA